MSDSQILRDKVSAALWQLEQESLIEVCRYMKCGGLDKGGDPCSQSRRALIKMAESVLDEVEENEEDDEKWYCTDLLTFIGRHNTSQPHKEKHSEEPASKKKLEDVAALPHDPLQRPTDPQKPGTNRTLPEVTLRREFKIMGQIGESGQKEKLSYLSLVRQIELGLEKGHTETEIVEAVIRAVSPGLPLRDMLEIKRGLTLQSILTILKGHYKVDSSTELYNQLINISQEPKETALNFVFRAIELKEKLLWKAANEKTDEQYSPATIQRKFLRSIETGLSSDSVKFQILPYLSNVTISDEDLIGQVNEAAKLENERQEKRKRFTTAKNPKVQGLQIETQTDSNHIQSSSEANGPKSDAAVKTIKGKDTKLDRTDTQKIMEELRNDMKQMFLTVMETSHRPPRQRQRERGCQQCREGNVGESCPHCFKCGQDGHFSRGCRRQGALSGNGNGLPRGDQR